MPGEDEAIKMDAVKDIDAEDAEGRQRSTIAFPYNDLGNAAEMAQAIHNQVGAGDCDDAQLAAWTNQSPKSSGYRTQLSATRLFGLLESSAGGRYRLSQLGRMLVDPSRTREARSRAFLNVPLYSAVFEKYKGGVIPPPAALERDMEALGVAPKMKDRARRVFERSAEQGGFFEHGRNRLVMPGIAARDDAPPPPPPGDTEDEGSNGKGKFKGGSGGGGGPGDQFPDLNPFILGLLQTLPPPHSEWAAQDRAKWLQTAANIFDLIYKGEGGIEIKAAMAQRSPRPNDNER